MRIAQHKLALTSGSSSFASVLFFFAPHGMYRRHQEKHPAHIVRNGCREQGVYQRYMRWELALLAGCLVAAPTSPDRCQKLSVGRFVTRMQMCGTLANI